MKMFEIDNKNDPQNQTFLASFTRVRRCVRLAGGLGLLFCFWWGGHDWAWGAWLGTFLVEVNMSLLWKLLKRAHQWRGPGLKPTLLRFYLFFGVTAFLCFLIIRNNWGHPLGFLLGLLSFIVGLGLGLLTLAVRPVKA